MDIKENTTWKDDEIGILENEVDSLKRELENIGR